MAAVTAATSAAGTATMNPYDADLAGWLGGPDGRRETGETAAGTATMNPYDADFAGWLGGPDGRRETGETAAEVIVTGVPTGR
jgi:hypothetical protein